MSEKEAAAAGRETATGIFPFPGNSKAVITGETSGFVKIVSDAKTGAVLGGQIVGPRATELIAEIALAVTSELTIEEIGGLIHPHPTVSEAVMEAVHDIEGHSIHKMPKRR
jgi:dihydrolipoamide dehydrogenase